MHPPSGIPYNAVVLVGDGARALLFRNSGTPMSPKLAVEKQFEQFNPPTREQGTDRPTRGPTGFQSPRGNIEQSNWHQLNEERFASDIADKLYHMAHANSFQRIIIVAPPKVLGALRKSLHKEVLDRIEAEVPKELASSPVRDIERELSELAPGTERPLAAVALDPDHPFWHGRREQALRSGFAERVRSAEIGVRGESAQLGESALRHLRIDPSREDLRVVGQLRASG